MSEALKYLMAVRPEATEAYFTFLKKSGEHLDAKTRSLISVITKIDNQTETGFRQYLSRALREGNSANEVLDAIMVAFPTLGLSKIIWAIDIIRDMDLPEFYPENMVQKSHWHLICKIGKLKQRLNHFEIDKRAIFVYNKNDQLKVYDSRCPHQQTNIPFKSNDDCLICPKHQWKFDLNSGDCIEIGNQPLKSLEHKIEKNQLMVFW